MKLDKVTSRVRAVLLGAPGSRACTSTILAFCKPVITKG